MTDYLPADYNQLVMCTPLYNTGFGEALHQIKTLSICDLQLRHGERKFMLYFMFNQFCTNLLDMPHWVWRENLTDHVTWRMLSGIWTD